MNPNKVDKIKWFVVVICSIICLVIIIKNCCALSGPAAAPAGTQTIECTLTNRGPLRITCGADYYLQQLIDGNWRDRNDTGNVIRSTFWLEKVPPFSSAQVSFAIDFFIPNIEPGTYRIVFLVNILFGGEKVYHRFEVTPAQ